MRPSKTISIVAPIVIALSLTIIVLAQRNRPTAFSPPPEVQSEAFSISSGSPITATGVHPADVMGTGSGPLIACENLGLVCTDVISGTNDDVKGLSYGYDFSTGGLPPFQFSVGKGSRGLPGTAVRVEVDCNPAEPEADVFETQLDGSNEQDLDGDGVACGTNSGFGLNLAEGSNGDNLDEVDRDPCLFVDPNCDGVLDEPIFVTLAPGSPTLAAITATPADIIMTSGDVEPHVWANGVTDLGLQNGDVIDALCVKDSGNGAYGSGDFVLFSLAPGSPTLSTWSASAADVLAPKNAFRYLASTLGLQATDDIDGLNCAQDVTLLKLYLPIVVRNG
jgi:hypothetical protein